MVGRATSATVHLPYAVWGDARKCIFSLFTHFADKLVPASWLGNTHSGSKQAEHQSLTKALRELN